MLSQCANIWVWENEIVIKIMVMMIIIELMSNVANTFNALQS